jgi:uncharacterized protein (PEP-CTERM system associated)
MMMRGTHRTGRSVRLAIGLVPLAWLLLPGAAAAQIVSPGNLSTATLPSMPAAAGAPAATGANGNTAGGPGSGLPGLFDQFALFGDLSEFYSTNANGGSGGGADYDTRAGVGVMASSATLHSFTQISYYGSADYFARNSQNLIFNNNLNANTVAELIPDHVILQASAFANPVYASRLGQVAPAGQVLPPGSNGDVYTNYGYVISPDFGFRLGDFLRSDLLPSYSAYYYDKQAGAPASPLGIGVADFYGTKTVTERLSSGQYFERLQWGAIASYSEMGQATGGLTQRTAMGNLSYAIDHGISLVGTAGYETVKSQFGFKSPLNGPIFLGGMQFNTARLTGEFQLGEQYRTFSAVGHLNYQITSRLNFTASAQDGVNAPGAGAFQTPGQLLGAYLGGLASGQFQLPSSGILTLGDVQNAVGLQNSIARLQMENASLGYANDYYNLGLSVYNTVQDTQTAVPTGQNGDLRSQGIVASYGRPLGRDLNASLYAGFHTDSLQVGSDTGIDLQGRMDYSLNPTTGFYGYVGYYQRNSSNALSGVSSGSGDFSEVTVGLGIHHQFL